MAARKKPAPKRGASRYQAPAKKPVPGWIWLICGLVIGGFIMFLTNLEPGGKEIKRDKETAKPKEQPKRSAPSNGQAVKPKYDFYTLLPESEVVVPQQPAPEAPTTAAPETKPATSVNYYLQAGSFRQRSDADQVRAQILLLGMDVKLENATINGNQWYRVQVGPFDTRDSLDQAQRTLSGNGFNNLLPQQR